MDITQAGRLLTLAHFLKTEVKPSEFDLGSYCKTYSASTPNLIDHPCGTTACALGWCTAVFPDRFGLKDGDNVDLLTHARYCGIRFNRRMTYWGDRRVREFFGVSMDEFELLFDATRVRTPKQEAKVIEQLVAKHGYECA